MARTVTWIEGLVMDSIDQEDKSNYDIGLAPFLEGDSITGATAVGTDITILSTTFTDQNIVILVQATAVVNRAKVRFQVTTATETHNRSFFIPIKSL